MNQNNDNIDRLSEDFFRHSYSKLVAVLIRYFGLKQVEVAEDIVQDTLLTATEQWSIKGIPLNPEGWLMDVAKKKMINFLKRDQQLKNKILPELEKEQQSLPGVLSDSGLIKDSTLKMIFCVCHPYLPPESKIALSLKTLCGFSISEIARALLTTEVNINKRLYRAKTKFRDGTISFALPSETDITQRIDAVYKTLYLLFNEGYYSSSKNEVINIELCFEAVRLIKIILIEYPNENKGKALLALMLLSIARFESRLDNNGTPIALRKQDRSLWDNQLIGEGIAYLHESIKGEDVNTYQLQAGIAAEHCLATDVKSTNWKSIHQQYRLLSELENNGRILLNKAIAKFYSGEKDEAICDLVKLGEQAELKNYCPYYLTLGDLHQSLGKSKKANYYYVKALKFSTTSLEKSQIKQRLEK